MSKIKDFCSAIGSHPVKILQKFCWDPTPQPEIESLLASEEVQCPHLLLGLRGAAVIGSSKC